MAAVYWCSIKVLLPALVFSLVVRESYGLESCCSDLGCFNSARPFYHSVYRPVNSVPNCSIMSTFGLHLNTGNRTNVKVTQRLDPYNITSISKSSFDVRRETKLLIHGFSDIYDWPWWADMVTALLKEGNYNVIRLDWGKATVEPYTQSIADARLAGAYVAKFISVLKDKFQYAPQRVHIISHGLGVHTAGYVGERVDKIGRITALDPGRLYFEDTDPAVRLDPTDALVVESLVTDGENYPTPAVGSLRPMAHINVFLNGGSYQPGCESGIVFYPWGDQLNYDNWNYNTTAMLQQTEYQNKACSHWRAFFLFSESIPKDSCRFVAFECPSYRQFKDGSCFPNYKNGSSTLIGYRVNTSLAQPGRLRYFDAATDYAIPFCTTSFSFKFRLQSAAANPNVTRERGFVSVKLTGQNGTSPQTELTNRAMDLSPGSEHKIFFQIADSGLGVIQALHIYWVSRHNVSSPAENTRRHVLYFDGDFQLTSEDGQVTTHHPVQQHLEERFQLLAYPIRTNSTSTSLPPSYSAQP